MIVLKISFLLSLIAIVVAQYGTKGGVGGGGRAPGLTAGRPGSGPAVSGPAIVGGPGGAAGLGAAYPTGYAVVPLGRGGMGAGMPGFGGLSGMGGMPGYGMPGFGGMPGMGGYGGGIPMMAFPISGYGGMPIGQGPGGGRDGDAQQQQTSDWGDDTPGGGGDAIGQKKIK